MKILYDDRGFRMPHGGVPKYFCEIMSRISACAHIDLAVKETENFYLQQPPWNIPAPTYDVNAFAREYLFGHRFPGAGRLYVALSRVFPNAIPFFYTTNDRIFTQLTQAGDYDLVHLTAPHLYGTTWRAIPRNKPVVVTVHDLIYELVEHRDDVGALRRKVLGRANEIISVSEFTRGLLVERYGVPECKITVVHHGYVASREMSAIEEYRNLRYILFVGKRGGYKNFDYFARAISPLLSSDRSLHLVCTGDAFGAAERAYFESAGVSGQIHQRFSTDKEMTWLYHNAAVFVYPSKMEGFGIPILDAFASGCPVLLSRASCFPEVGGEAAEYFELDNVDDLQGKLSRILADENARAEMKRKGLERVRQFSWEKCAAETMEVYRKCL